MGAFVECANGHIYDTEVYASCPYCNGGGNRIEFGGGDSGIGKTAPVSGYMPQNMTPEVGATVAPAGYQNQFAPQGRNVEDKDTGKTVAVFQKTMKMEPVVGWFVCIEGPDKGKDFRILAKNNTIGRGEKMDICIKGDSSISRENHARIGYDEKHNAFHLIPGESANNIYIGEDPVYVPTKLEADMIIELGETKLIFVPFCSDKFTWKEGVKE
ncbi:MAG: FHA domain-containing protein [Lachnospiraceae bacterium]|nr:FHA domain-containing protein [Lachnospiraceae bacterium]